jgi:MFS family permease
VSSVAAALLLAALDPGEGYVLLLAAAFMFNTIAACQDIATDGLAVRMLDTHERGLANGLQVGAYRFGMILGGGLLLWVFAHSNWSVMFGCMAAMLAVTVLPVLALREPRGRSTRCRRDSVRLRTAGSRACARPACSCSSVSCASTSSAIRWSRR